MHCIYSRSTSSPNIDLGRFIRMSTYWVEPSSSVLWILYFNQFIYVLVFLFTSIAGFSFIRNCMNFVYYSTLYRIELITPKFMNHTVPLFNKKAYPSFIWNLIMKVFSLFAVIILNWNPGRRWVNQNWVRAYLHETCIGN